jgi:hypothetical protein
MVAPIVITGKDKLVKMRESTSRERTPYPARNKPRALGLRQLMLLHEPIQWRRFSTASDADSYVWNGYILDPPDLHNGGQ